MMEILSFLIKKYDIRCFFCNEKITEEDVKHDRITIHHKNFIHTDNRVENLVIAHRTCHKRFHMKTNHALKELKTIAIFTF